MRKPQFFVSHSLSSEKEREWVRTFVNTLTRHGASVWWDESRLAPGELWEDAFAKSLRQSDVIALIVTPDSLKRPDVFFELGAAIGMGKRVVPILPKEMAAADLPSPLRSRRGLIKESPEKTARELLQATRAEESSNEAKD